MIQEYKDTRIQRYKDTRIQGYKDTRIQGYKDKNYKVRVKIIILRINFILLSEPRRKSINVYLLRVKGNICM